MQKGFSDADIQSGLKTAMELSNTADLNDFVSLFDEREKRNFSLFSVCNDMSNEVTTLTTSIDQMKLELKGLEQDMQNGWGNEMVKSLNRKRDQAKVWSSAAIVHQLAPQ